MLNFSKVKKKYLKIINTLFTKLVVIKLSENMFANYKNQNQNNIIFSLKIYISRVMFFKPIIMENIKMEMYVLNN